MNNDFSSESNNNSTIKILFFLGMIFVCLDIFSINLGNFKLKISYVGFLIYLIIFAYSFGLKMKTKNFALAAMLMLGFLPSVVFSSSPVTSVAFYAGTLICLVIMFIFSKISYLAPSKVIDLLFVFYRFSVILTAVLVLTGIENRGHFLLYEPSYYAVVLIPYFCITFHRAFLYGLRIFWPDMIFILMAIVLSQSVSMVLWCFLCFVFTYISFGHARWKHLFYFFVVVLAFLLSAYFLHARTRFIIDRFFGLVSDPSDALSLLVFVVGNRLQRVMMAYEAFTASPFFGIGLGALKEYSSNNFIADNFMISGVTATDFVVESPAANIFVEVAAEAGLIGFIAWMSVLFFVHRQKNNAAVLAPFKIAFYVTMIALLIDSSYLRNYVWALYGIVVGISSVEQWRVQPNWFYPAALRKTAVKN